MAQHLYKIRGTLSDTSGRKSGGFTPTHRLIPGVSRHNFLRRSCHRNLCPIHSHSTDLDLPEETAEKIGNRHS